MVTECIKRARKDNIMIPQCPPANTIELGGKNAEATYYLWAWASNQPQKATYDLLIEG